MLTVADGIDTFWDGWCYCHCGRWNNHIGWKVFKADLITLVADGKATGSIYFNLSSVLFIRTSSHMWGRLYLPLFLFGDGLLTLMNIDSLISLERFCSSLPTMQKFSSVVVWPVMLPWSWIGGGGFQMFFKSLSKCPSCLSFVLLITFQSVTFKSIDIFPYTRWSHISWTAKSLCCLKIGSVTEKLSFNIVNQTEWETYIHLYPFIVLQILFKIFQYIIDGIFDL